MPSKNESDNALLNTKQDRQSPLQRLFVFCSIMATSLFLYVLVTFRIPDAPLSADPAYYARTLPLAYWLGMFLSILLPLVLLQSGSMRLRIVPQLVSTVLPIMYLIGLPCFAYKNPLFTDVYGISESSEVLSSFGTTTLTGSLSYEGAFPGGLLWIAQLAQAGDLHYLSVSKYYPLYSFVIMSVFLLLIGRRICPNYAVIAPFVQLSLMVNPHYNLVPQNLALLLFVVLLFLLLVLFRFSSRTKFNVAAGTSMILVLCSATVITHPGASIVAILLLFGAFLCRRRVYVTVRKSIGVLPSNLFRIVLIVSLIFCMWLMYIATAHFEMFITIFRNMGRNLLAFELLQFEPTGYNYNPNPVIPPVIVMIYLKALLILALALFLVLFTLRKGRKPTHLLCVLLVAVSLPNLQSFLTGAYIGRSLLYTVIVESVLVACSTNFLDSRLVSGITDLVRSLLKTSVLTFLVLFLALVPLTSHYVDSHEYVPDSVISAESFYREKLSNDPMHSWPTFRVAYFYWSNLSSSGAVPTPGPSLVISCVLAYNFYETKQSHGELYDEIMTNYENTGNCVFSSGSTKIILV